MRPLEAGITSRWTLRLPEIQFTGNRTMRVHSDSRKVKKLDGMSGFSLFDHSIVSEWPDLAQ
jgi:hypothetical protein